MRLQTNNWWRNQFVCWPSSSAAAAAAAECGPMRRWPSAGADNCSRRNAYDSPQQSKACAIDQSGRLIMPRSPRPRSNGHRRARSIILRLRRSLSNMPARACTYISQVEWVSAWCPNAWLLRQWPPLPPRCPLQIYMCAKAYTRPNTLCVSRGQLSRLSACAHIHARLSTRPLYRLRCWPGKWNILAKI